MTTTEDARGVPADGAIRGDGHGPLLLPTAAPEQLHPDRDRRRRRPDPRRVLLWLGRAVLWALLAVLLLRGVLDLLGDLGGRPAALIGAAPSTDAQDVGAYAATFAADYLTFDPADIEGRTLRLAGYLAPGLDPRAGWDGVGTQTASAAVPLSATEDGGRTVVTVAVRATTGTTPPRWSYLAVPVHVGPLGGFVVTDLPATVPPPLLARAPAPQRPVVDDALSDELLPTLTSFFEAWGAGDASDLDRFAAEGTTLAGLDGSLELAELTVLEVAAGDERRGARAQVRWRDPLSGAALEQAYDLALVADGGRWYVESVGTGVAPAADDAQDSP